MHFEPNPCVCGADDSVREMDITDVNFRTTDERGVLLRCRACGSLRPDRFPDDASLSTAYANYYTAAASAHEGFVKRALNATRRHYLDRAIAPDATSVLDYGCGSGAYLSRLAALGHPARRFGCDLFPPPEADRHAFEWLSMDDFDRGERRYDHITLSHVIEHTRDPAAVIDRVVRCLAPGGTLWIATPDADAPMIKALGPAARDIDFPRHRIILSRKALSALLGRHGRIEWLRSPIINTAMTLKTSLANAPTMSTVNRLIRSAIVLADVTRPSEIVLKLRINYR